MNRRQIEGVGIMLAFSLAGLVVGYVGVHEIAYGGPVYQTSELVLGIAGVPLAPALAILGIELGSHRYVATPEPDSEREVAA